MTYGVNNGWVNIELRSVPDCPNLAPVRDRLRTALAELGRPPTFREVVGDYPSPSVLIDGADVMGATGDGPAACRLDLPTVEDLRTAIQRAGTARNPTADTGVADCCASQVEAINADRPLRAAALPDGLRQVHSAVLRHFATTGRAPDGAEVSAMAAAAGVDLKAALAELAAADLVAVDGEGRMVAAYPFSPVPTAHVVSLGGVQVHSMCAIDALGIPFMLGTDAVITSADPQTGEQVRVQVTGGVAGFTPHTTVVVYAATGASGRSVDTCCSTINFFTSSTSAQAWVGAHPDLAATILDQDQAVALGRDIFGPLLTGGLASGSQTVK